jgi:hypothetical protein
MLCLIDFICMWFWEVYAMCSGSLKGELVSLFSSFSDDFEDRGLTLVTFSTGLSMRGSLRAYF